MQTVGAPFRFEGRVFTIYATLECLLSDGEGLKVALDTLGFNGIRPCIRCQNVLRKGSGLASRRVGFVEVGCADHTKFVPSTPQDLEREVNTVVAARAQVLAGTRSPGNHDANRNASSLSSETNHGTASSWSSEPIRRHHHQNVFNKFSKRVHKFSNMFKHERCQTVFIKCS